MVLLEAAPGAGFDAASHPVSARAPVRGNFKPETFGPATTNDRSIGRGLMTLTRQSFASEQHCQLARILRYFEAIAGCGSGYMEGNRLTWRVTQTIAVTPKFIADRLGGGALVIIT